MWQASDHYASSSAIFNYEDEKNAEENWGLENKKRRETDCQTSREAVKSECEVY